LHIQDRLPSGIPPDSSFFPDLKQAGFGVSGNIFALQQVCCKASGNIFALEQVCSGVSGNFVQASTGSEWPPYFSFLRRSDWIILNKKISPSQYKISSDIHFFYAAMIQYNKYNFTFVGNLK
jgi:hypothetical protein